MSEITLREHMTRIGKISTPKKARACRLNGCKPKKPNPIKGQAIAYRHAGHTLTQTAEAFGVSVGTICRWCKGSRNGS